MSQKKSKIFIFIDESGKPEVFSTKGVNLVEQGLATKFLVLTAVRTQDQLSLQQKITDFKSSLLKNPDLKNILSSAYTLASFHAHHDYDQVKQAFFTFVTSLDIDIDVLVVEKLKCPLSLQKNPSGFYGVMAGQLLKNLCHYAETTEVIFSRKDSKLKLRQELEREIDRVRIEYLNDNPRLSTGVKLSYHHNPHYSHGGLQIADYISYAVFQLFERKERKWYEIVKTKIKKIQDVCNKKYFTRSNPL